MSQAEIDARNADFWNELCGSHAAKALGMTGSDRASLAKFDRWFFDFTHMSMISFRSIH